MKLSSSSYSPLSSDRHRRHRCCNKRCRTLCGLSCFLFLVIFVIVVGSYMLYVFETYPAHVSCDIKWTFNGSCIPVANKIEHQIKTWSSSMCNGTQKCMYELVFANQSLIEGIHRTPKFHFIDSFAFNLAEQNNTCFAEGRSSSNLWFAVLDFGTNYCNLHNLITGSALDKASGYSETTSNAICTQYSSHNCLVY